MTPTELAIGRARIRFTDRRDGASRSPYAAANLAMHVGDDPAAVEENRRRLAVDVGDVASDWVWLRQVHGDTVVAVDDLPAGDRSTLPPEADAAVTTRSGTALCVLVADCAPIVLVGEDAVGVVHAGWAGLERGVVGRGVDALRRHDVAGAPLRAVLGPCIRPGRYEFGAEDLARLVDRFGPSVAATTLWGTPAFDLPAAVRIELARAGVDDLIDVGVCTSASPDHFSHRRDGVTGRQAVVAVLAP
ncbi:MAG: polyphenol oxidase family protein [Acidimicrobiia bacterium]